MCIITRKMKLDLPFILMPRATTSYKPLHWRFQAHPQCIPLPPPFVVYWLLFTHTVAVGDPLRVNSSSKRVTTTALHTCSFIVSPCVSYLVPKRVAFCQAFCRPLDFSGKLDSLFWTWKPDLPWSGHAPRCCDYHYLLCVGFSFSSFPCAHLVLHGSPLHWVWVDRPATRSDSRKWFVPEKSPASIWITLAPWITCAYT